MFLFDKLHIVTGLAPKADLFDTSFATDRINVSKYQAVAAIINIGVGATGTTSVVVNTYAAASGGSANPIAFDYRRVSDCAVSDVPGARVAATSSGFTTTAGSNQKYIIEIDPSQLDEGYPFIEIAGTESVNSPVAASIDFLLGEPRFAGVTPITAIS